MLGQNVAIFAESLGVLRRQRPDLHDALGGTPFRALGIVPLVVSDHTIGAVVVHWNVDREVSDPDRNFLFLITGTAAQAVERARLTVTEFVNLERTQHLHQLSSALAAATTPGDVAHAAIAGCRRALGARSAVVRIPASGERALSCLASSGHPALLSRAMVPVDESHAGGAFLRGRTDVITLGAVADLPQDIAVEVVPRLLEGLADPVTIVTEPLIGSIGPLGVLSLAFVGQPEPSEPDLRFLSTLAGLTAQALERAQVFEHEREALRLAEAGRERLSLLSEVTRLLSSSLEPTTVIRRTMSLVEGRLADSCIVQVPGENGLARLDVREPRDAGTPPAARGRIGEDVPFDSEAPAAIAFRTGRTQLAPLEVRGDATDPQATVTALAVPLTANGEVIGVMTFVDGPDRVFEADDVSLATEVASRAGVALSNATRFQREHVVAEVLQRAVLPDSLPIVDALALDAEYRAGVAGTYAGGDWYDVFELDDDTVFFSVGDVMGKGASAAALMGQVRSAIRAYAVCGQSPTEVLSSLDGLFDALIEDRVVTAVVGTITPSSGRVVLSNAGHPPPLVVRADGSATYCPMQRSLLLAAGLNGAPRPLDELVLDRGDSLIMYSDGLIERRGRGDHRRDGTAGFDSNAYCARRLAGPAGRHVRFHAERRRAHRRSRGALPELCRDLGGAHKRSSLWVRHVMVCRHCTSNPSSRAHPLARHWVAAHLRDLPSEVTGSATLLTSELVTNAVLHAATPMCVTLHVLPDRIRIDVADGNPAFPSIKEYGREAATGRGLTLFDTLASNWGDPGRRRRQDRLVRVARRLRGPAEGPLRRELPLRPHRRHTFRPPRRIRNRCGSSRLQPARHPGCPPAEVERGVRGALPRAPPHEGAGRQLARFSRRCPNGSRSW